MGRRPASAALVVGVCAATLAAGYVAKDCLGLRAQTRLSFLCHTDVYSLYHLRGMDRRLFPYVSGGLVATPAEGDPRTYSLQLVDGANEYPVLTGLVMWLPSHLASSPRGYLAASAGFLAAFGLLTAWLLARMSGRRAYLFAASPLLFLYAFHNWDLPAVAAATAGCWCWWVGKHRWAAVCFGLGGAFKLYPLLFLAPLALDARRRGGMRDALAALGAGLLTLGLVNLPILAIDPPGWAVAFRFHALRIANWDSMWGALANTFTLDVGTVNVASGLLVVAVIAAALVAAERRAERDGVYPFLQASAAVLAGFLLGSKVHSPQHALWLVPWFALVHVGSRWHVGFVVSNLVIYAAIFGVAIVSPSARDAIVSWSIWIRAGLLAALVLLFSKAEAISPPADERERSD